MRLMKMVEESASKLNKAPYHKVTGCFNIIRNLCQRFGVSTLYKITDKPLLGIKNLDRDVIFNRITFD